MGISSMEPNMEPNKPFHQFVLLGGLLRRWPSVNFKGPGAPFVEAKPGRTSGDFSEESRSKCETCSPPNQQQVTLQMSRNIFLKHGIITFVESTHHRTIPHVRPSESLVAQEMTKHKSLV